MPEIMMDKIVQMMPVFWVVMIIIFSIIEGITLGLTSIWFAFAAVVALLLSLIHINIMVQGIVFLILSLVFVIYTRPIAKKYLKIGNVKTNIDALIAKRGVVVKEIESYNTGQVKVQGQIWTAKSPDFETLKCGDEVEIVDVEGVKLIVKKITIKE